MSKSYKVTYTVTPSREQVQAKSEEWRGHSHVPRMPLISVFLLETKSLIFHKQNSALLCLEATIPYQWCYKHHLPGNKLPTEERVCVSSASWASSYHPALPLAESLYSPFIHSLIFILNQCFYFTLKVFILIVTRSPMQPMYSAACDMEKKKEFMLLCKGQYHLKSFICSHH